MQDETLEKQKLKRRCGVSCHTLLSAARPGVSSRHPHGPSFRMLIPRASSFSQFSFLDTAVYLFDVVQFCVSQEIDPVLTTQNHPVLVIHPKCQDPLPPFCARFEFNRTCTSGADSALAGKSGRAHRKQAGIGGHSRDGGAEGCLQGGAQARQVALDGRWVRQPLQPWLEALRPVKSGSPQIFNFS